MKISEFQQKKPLIVVKNLDLQFDFIYDFILQNRFSRIIFHCFIRTHFYCCYLLLNYTKSLLHSMDWLPFLFMPPDLLGGIYIAGVVHCKQFKLVRYH
jgi:hypothetical protein